MVPKFVAFKSDVRLTLAHFDAVMVELFRALLHTAPPLVQDTVVVTSGSDGAHKPGSFHYVSRALDVRFLGGDRAGAIVAPTGVDAAGAWDMQKQLAQEWAARLRQVLGPDYDVVVESDHIHVERDPKR